MVVALLAVGCGSAELKPVTTPDPRILPLDEQPAPAGCPQEGGDTSGQESTGAVSVLSAPRFRDVLVELKSGFGAEHPKVNMEIHTGETPALKDRLVAGEAADIFVVDDAAAMKEVVDACRVSDRSKVFARGEGGEPFEIAVLQPLRNLPASQRFVGYVIADKGQRILQRHGFVTPD